MLENNNSTQGKWFKLNDAARMLGVSEITLRRKVKAGKMKYEFQNGKYYIQLRDEELAAATEANLRAPTNLRFDTEAAAPEVKNLRDQLQQRENLIRDQKRSIEDQQTLISFLEEQIKQMEASRA